MPDKLSTGQVATLLSVTPDTVLKWIKRGRLPATRTAGGHFRVRPADVERLRGRGDDADDGTADAPPGEPVYCWEFHARGEAPSPTCTTCLVYRARALRCYELAGLPLSGSHAGTRCGRGCIGCPCYRAV